MRLIYLFTIGFTALALTAIWTGPNPAVAPINFHGPTGFTVSLHVDENTAEAWFAEMRPSCNPVQVETQHRWSPAPEGMEGVAYSAACYALAGHIDTARTLILGLEGDDQWQAAGIVFNIGHPVADAGNDVAAGPIMELVVEFWSNHYMALYHAGASRYALGEPEVGAAYLERFLQNYSAEDGWTRAAREMLRQTP